MILYGYIIFIYIQIKLLLLYDWLVFNKKKKYEKLNSKSTLYIYGGIQSSGYCDFMSE